MFNEAKETLQWPKIIQYVTGHTRCNIYIDPAMESTNMR